MNPKKASRPIQTQMLKINTELLTLTYGAIVAQIIKDSENILDANEQMEKMQNKLSFTQFERGYNIGQRLIDEFLAKSETRSCRNAQEVAENIAKVAFPMFLGVTAEFEILPSQEKTQIFTINLSDNPLYDFVELPEHLNGLDYSAIISGAIVGALRAIHWIAKCKFTKDQLKGDDKTTIQVDLLREKFKEDD